MAHLVFFGGLGMVAGALARWWLARLPRGALVAPPWCELVVGALWAAAGYWWSAGRLGSAWLPLLLGLGWLVVAASAVDLLHRRLPDAVTLPALPAALLLAVPLGGAAVARAALGAAALGGGYLAVRLVAPPALGAGDVKLAAPLGAALGAASWSAVVIGVFAAALLTLAAAVGVAVVRRVVAARVTEPVGGRGRGRGRWWGAGGEGGWDGGVPHGPAMLATAWVVLAVAGTAPALVAA